MIVWTVLAIATGVVAIWLAAYLIFSKKPKPVPAPPVVAARAEREPPTANDPYRVVLNNRALNRGPEADYVLVEGVPYLTFSALPGDVLYAEYGHGVREWRGLNIRRIGMPNIQRFYEEMLSETTTRLRDLNLSIEALPTLRDRDAPLTVTTRDVTPKAAEKKDPEPLPRYDREEPV